MPSDHGSLSYYASALRSSDTEVLMQYEDFMAHVRVEQVLDATAEILLVLNEHRQVIYLNAQALEALGYSDRGQAIGLRFGELVGCERLTAAPSGCGTSKACSQCGAAKAMVRSLKGAVAEDECRISRTDGREPLDLRVRCTPLSIDSSRYLVMTVHDVADAHRRRALEHIFFHDVLNTAGSLSGYAELLHEAGPEDVEEFRGTIVQLAAQLLDEIQAQRILTMAEEDQWKPTLQPVLTEALVHQVVRQFARMSLSVGRSVSIDPRTARQVILSDATILKRIVGNMLKNALEAGRPGGAITLGCDQSLSNVRFWVRNPEVMPMSVQQQVFQRSYSTKGRGRGLGTYSVKLLSEKYLGGRASFTSDPANGTTFFIEIPTAI